MTRTFCAGRPMASAISRCAPNGFWVEAQTVALSAFDLRQGGMGLHRGMSDVAVEVGLLEGLAGELPAFRKVPALSHHSALGVGLEQVVEDGLVVHASARARRTRP